MASLRTQELERVFAMGGYDGSSNLDSVEEFDPDTLTWNPAPANLLEGRSLFGAVALKKNSIC